MRGQRLPLGRCDGSDPLAAGCRGHFMNEIFRSWIDAPVGEELLSVGFLVRGWSYRRDGVPVDSIRVRTSNKTFAGIYGEARPDVARAFHNEPGSGCSGYQVPVAL